MGGNIVRGLIELITNADDAYFRQGTGSGRIAIEGEHHRGRDWRMIVRDRATGMTRNELYEKLTKLAGRTSGFETGLDVRGNLGRGAKDLVAFGRVEFETVKDGVYADLLLLQYPELGHDYRLFDRPALVADRDRLGIPRGNGTVVTVNVAATYSCPLHDNLTFQLCNHYALRDIMSDPNREIILVNLNNGKRNRLTQRDERTSGPMSFDGDLGSDGYPGTTAALQLWKLPQLCEQPQSDSTRPCGILIQGRRAVYENSLFSFENNRHAGWFAGRLTCPYIDQLANEFDDRLENGVAHPTSNPVPIITRRREGLTRGHPFADALSTAVDEVLATVVAEEEERERREGNDIENDETRRSLQRAAQTAGRFLQEAMREIQEEELETGQEGDVEPLQLVPPAVAMDVGEVRTLSLLAQSSGLKQGAEVTLIVKPSDVLEILEGFSVALGPHRRREHILIAQVHIRSVAEGEAMITASIDSREALAWITVEPPEQKEPPEVPALLTFEHPRYRVRWGKRRHLTVIAPASVVTEYGSIVRITSDDPEGVVIEGGGQITLHVKSNGDIAAGMIIIESRRLGAKAVLVAAHGEEEARCRVSVEQRDEGLPDLAFQIVADQPGIWRALFDPPEPKPGEQQILKIYGQHPALKAYLGGPPDYSDQNTVQSKAVLAEILTEAIVRTIVIRKYQKSPESTDAGSVYYEHVKFSLRLLPLMQNAFGVHG
jgi:hypothetical protein